MNEFTKDRSGTGTREWSESSYNVGIGCKNACLYCYARVHALRFGIIKTRDEWSTERLSNKKIKPEKRKGIIMFPTQHDITPFYLPEIMKALDALLSVGNKILLVSKPHPECIEAICERYVEHKDNILFRFTIGDVNPYISSFWEPGAPLPEERFEALGITKHYGFQTSVSIEPMLRDIEGTLCVAHAVKPFVTEKIWIGKMNKIDERVKASSPGMSNIIKAIKIWQSDFNILRLVNELRNDPMIEWKDSIKKVIEKENK